MKVAVVGSRRYPHADLVRRVIRSLKAKHPDALVVSGGAPGVDSWAEDEARKVALSTLVLRADWKRHGRSAGFKRNTLIVHEADVVVAFWDENSPGTRHTIHEARRAGKKVVLWNRYGQQLVTN